MGIGVRGLYNKSGDCCIFHSNSGYIILMFDASLIFNMQVMFDASLILIFKSCPVGDKSCVVGDCASHPGSCPLH